MADHHRQPTRLGVCRQQLHQQCAALCVQRIVRLVEQPQRAFTEQDPGNRHPPSLPLGQATKRTRSHVQDIQCAQHLGRTFTGPGHGLHLECETQILDPTEGITHTTLVPQVRQLPLERGAGCDDTLAAPCQRPGTPGHQPGQTAQQGALASAIAALELQHLAGLQAEIDLAQQHTAIAEAAKASNVQAPWRMLRRHHAIRAWPWRQGLAPPGQGCHWGPAPEGCVATGGQCPCGNRCRFFLVRQVGGMHVLRPLTLACEVHGVVVVAVSAFQGIVGFQARPFVLRQLQALGIKFFRRIHRAKDLAPHLLGRLHLARHLVGPVVRHVAVRADRAHPGTVGVVDGALQLGEDVVAHFMATRTELLGVRDFHRGIESPPEQDARNEPANRQKPKAEVDAGAPYDGPVALE